MSLQMRKRECIIACVLQLLCKGKIFFCVHLDLNSLALEYNYEARCTLMYFASGTRACTCAYGWW